MKTELEIKPTIELGEEVQEYMRACDKLIEYAHQPDRPMTHEECLVVLVFVRELQKEIGSYYEKHLRYAA
jgi:hypothetical protein